jgi:RimJ/RimL family protein N-acetyltransferase
VEIRKVTEHDDFDAIGNIYAQSWKYAYKGIVPQDYLDSLDSARWAPVLSRRSHDAFVLVENGRYIGTASICAARDEAMAGWGEIISIYMHPCAMGEGLAAPLFKAVMDALAERGFQDIYLWVLEENTRAQKFYEKNGFIKNGDTMDIVIGGRKLVEVRYVCHIVESI